MGALSGLKPERVFYYFEEITKIPHGSGNVKGISDYLVKFGESHGLFTKQDELYNVIFKKPATAGYEDQPILILQGHMDMVAVHKPEYRIDMRTQGLKAYVDGDYVRAEGTSLGGDDGIAVAYALALLESREIPHPALEVIVTTEEEVGMDGARGIDLSCLEGHRLLNLDSEDEGIFLTGCAGGARAACMLSLRISPTFMDGSLLKANSTVLEIRIGGLRGGHSGDEIHKERGNSNKLCGRLLYELSTALEVGLVELEGGLADNAIPRETRMRIVVSEEDLPEAREVVDHFRSAVTEELCSKDPGFFVETEFVESLVEGAFSAYEIYEARQVAAFLYAAPNGVQGMSADVPGLVETSLNLGILKMVDITSSDESPRGECRQFGLEHLQEGRALHAEFSVRSSVESAREALLRQLIALTADLCGGGVRITGEYPGWKFRKDSPLREKMIRVYEDMYGESPRIEAIHAGLECGLLGSKISDLDCVSIGPDIEDIHTTEEHLSISSTARVWGFLLKLLAEKE